MCCQILYFNHWILIIYSVFNAKECYFLPILYDSKNKQTKKHVNLTTTYIPHSWEDPYTYISEYACKKIQCIHICVAFGCVFYLFCLRSSSVWVYVWKYYVCVYNEPNICCISPSYAMYIPFMTFLTIWLYAAFIYDFMIDYQRICQLFTYANFT